MGSGSVVFQLFADQVKRLEDGLGGAGHGNDPLGDRTVGNVDFSAGLFPNTINNLSAFTYDGSYLLACHQQTDGKSDIGSVGGQRFVNVGHGDRGEVQVEEVKVRLFTDGLFLGWLAGCDRLGQAGGRTGLEVRVFLECCTGSKLGIN